MTDFRALLANDAYAVSFQSLGQYRTALLKALDATPPPLAPDYIDPEHHGEDRELLQVFYAACNAEGGTADEIHLRGIRAVMAACPALATPPPEPVAYIHKQGNYWEPSERVLQDDEKERGWTEEPLYAAPPPPEAPIDVTLEPSFSQRQQLLQGLSRYCFCHTSAHRYLKVWIRDYTRAALERWGQR